MADTKMAKANDKKYEKFKQLQKENPDIRLGVLLKKVKLAYPAYRVRAQKEEAVEERAQLPNKKMSEAWDQRVGEIFTDVIHDIECHERLMNKISTTTSFTPEDVKTILFRTLEEIQRL